MAEDDVFVVLSHDCNGFGFAKKSGPFGNFTFAVGKPVKVPKGVADLLIANNPAPWQGPGHDVFEVVKDPSAKGGEK